MGKTRATVFASQDFPQQELDQQDLANAATRYGFTLIGVELVGLSSFWTVEMGPKPATARHVVDSGS